MFYTNTVIHICNISILRPIKGLITESCKRNLFQTFLICHSTHCRGYIPHARESIGIQCKRLIDAGRVWYLEQRGFDAMQCHYVDKNISLENTLIIATLTNTNKGISNP